MTEPGDGLGSGDGLEEALRRSLSEAADRAEPGTDGLSRIRARIGQRPPRPWLVSVLFGGAERVRYWTWRGHWTRPPAPARFAHLRPLPRFAGYRRPRGGAGWLRA